jgi:hypothetical protein
MDMPFLLRFALEGLRHLDTTHCRQIIVIPDGFGADGVAALRQVVDCCGDSRVELARVRALAHFVVHGMRRSGGEIANWTHWAMIVEGINRAKCDYVFLHDADAFLLERDGLERQYRECRDHGMATLGVMARWDPFFREVGYTIPGTYELMFSARWVRRHAPLDLKGRWRQTAHGDHVFDTMLYPQFQDYHTGKVGILHPPLQLVHFAGAITLYRVFCDRAGQTVSDENFRLLFLALLEDVFPSPAGDRILPPTRMLARGLDDSSAMVTYASPLANREYPTFRAMIEDLCRSPMFQGSRAEQIRATIKLFDSHYRYSLTKAGLSVDRRLEPNAIELNPGSELASERIEFLREIVPTLSRLAILLNPSNPSHDRALQQFQAAAQSLGIELHVARASTTDEFESAFATIIAARAEGLVVLADGMSFDNYQRILPFTDVSRLPALFAKKEIVEAGGLMSYGPGAPVGLVDRGADAPDLPRQAPPRYELAINIKTAKALGLLIPSTLRAIADTLVE